MSARGLFLTTNDATTSSASSLRDDQSTSPLSVIIVSGALFVSGTSSAEPMRMWEAPYVYESNATHGGFAWEARQPSTDPQTIETNRRLVTELRRLSGLTWEQLAQLFEVSRRSVHFWASGKPLNSDHERRLLRVVDVIREVDRGDARSTRIALFTQSAGTTAFELLKAQKFDEARELLRPGIRQVTPAPPLLNQSAKSARRPLPIEERVDARHESIHRDVGNARAARTVRNKGRGSR